MHEFFPYCPSGNLKSQRNFVPVDSGKQVCMAYTANGSSMVTRTVYLNGKDATIRFAKRGMQRPDEVLAAAE